MSEAKHTPGLWELAGENRHFGYWISGPGSRPGSRTHICDTIGIDTVHLDRNRFEVGEVTKANATLIAASPDLLAALEDLVAKIPNDVYGWDSDVPNPIFNAARAAIAKAKGAS